MRRAFLLAEGLLDRKQWIEHRLEELAQIFSVAGFAVMDNHLHVLVRLDPQAAAGWSDEELVRRWGRLLPPCDRTRRALPVSDDRVQERLKEVNWVATARERLCSLSWFIKNTTKREEAVFSEGGGQRQLILAGGLVEAVKTESNPAVTFHWEVSRSTVARWRKALGVARMTEGTRRRWRQFAPLQSRRG